MSALPKPREFLTPEEYLEQERAAEERSEYLDGVVVAIAGGTSNHSLIASEIQYRLRGQFEGRPCKVYSADMKVRVERANLFRYPDASALCGPVLFHDATQDAYGNHALIVEVLSPATERYDRGDKFVLYRLLDSFVEYLLVAQDRMHAELFRKQPDGSWASQLFTVADDRIELESVGATLQLGDLYATVDWSAR